MSSNMINNNNSTFLWDSYRGIIRSRKGGWRIGQGVTNHGYDMLEGLAGKVSFFQVMILNATGRLPERRLADWFEALQICLSWPDPRIWCNQMGALGGTMRTSPVAATAAGLLAHESAIYGPQTLVKGMKFQQEALRAAKRGQSFDSLIEAECDKHGGKPKIMGFARPIAKGDERIPAMERVSNELGFPIGEYRKFAYEIEQILIDRFNESMNISGFMAAFMLDQGYSPQEAFNIVAVLVSSGITACYVDTFDRPPETFLPMRCDDIDYQGPPPREVPDRE